MRRYSRIASLRAGSRQQQSKKQNKKLHLFSIFFPRRIQQTTRKTSIRSKNQMCAVCVPRLKYIDAQNSISRFSQRLEMQKKKKISRSSQPEKGTATHFCVLLLRSIHDKKNIFSCIHRKNIQSFTNTRIIFHDTRKCVVIDRRSSSHKL